MAFESATRSGAPNTTSSQPVALISIVTPCFNEEGGIATCHAAIRAMMRTELPNYEYEHIFIDNCSTDGTVAILRDLAAGDPRTKIILNARNFGPARSPHHAMLEAFGDVVVPVLADLQTPPSLIPQMIAHWEKGCKVVIAVKRRADEALAWRTVRSTFYRMMSALSRVEQIPNFMGYGLYDRCVMDALRQLNEPEPYFRGLITRGRFRSRDGLL